MPTGLPPSLARLFALPEDQRHIGVFRVSRQLGKGGFAPVWLATEVYGEAELRTVALKLFALDGPGETTAGTAMGTTATDQQSREARKEQIVAEARALCQVEHPNIVRFITLAMDESGDILGLAMEYVRGTPLDQKIARAGKLAVGDTLAVGSALASALAAVHQVGLVHRDIKPANVIDAAGIYKLIDFGIAKIGRRSSKKGKKKGGAEANGEEVKDEPRPAPAPARPVTPLQSLDTADTILADRDGVQSVKPAPVVRPPIDPAMLDQLATLDVPVLPPTKPSDKSAPKDGSEGYGLAGTIGYMDPVTMATFAPATPASDLYSLGALLFECATGMVPAAAAAKLAGMPGPKLEVLRGSEPSPPIRELAPETPEALAKVIESLLAAEPAKRPRSAEAVAWELERIRRELAGRSRPLPESGPFRGLDRFEAEDHDVYFGRSVEIAAGLEMMRSRGLLALVGPSGSGKSSLARAGLLPAIEAGELGGWPKEWDTVIASPGADPHTALSLALEAFLEASHPGQVSKLAPDAVIGLLASAVSEMDRGLIILVDQLEELVTLAEDGASPGRGLQGESQAWAAQLLARLGGQPIPGVRCVVAARRDLLDALLALPELGRVLARGTLLVAPLTDLAWEEVLDRALEAYGYRLEDAAMRETLLGQLKGTSSAMPLVQFALTRLWELRDTEKKIIPRAALEKIGGIGGALEAHATATLAEVSRMGDGAREVAKDVLLSLTTPQGTRAAHPLETIQKRVKGPLTEKVVRALYDARLLVNEEAGLTIAHEALLVRWAELQGWIAEARSDRVSAEEVERETAAWLADQRSPERLLKGRRLGAAEELARHARVDLSDEAKDYLHRARRAVRRGRALIASPFVLAGIALGIFGYLRWDGQRVKTSYCASYVKKRQIARCLSVIDEDAAHHRARSFRLTTQGGRLLKVERVNGAMLQRENEEEDDGTLPVHEEVLASAWEYHYSADGRLRSIDHKDHRGQIRLREYFAGEDLSRLERRDRNNNPLPLPDALGADDKPSDASVVQIDYDAHGFIEKKRYFNLAGAPRRDRRGAYGAWLKNDARGVPLEIVYLGPDGNPAAIDRGVAGERRVLDRMGNVIELVAFDARGNPTAHDNSASTTDNTYDRYGNLIEQVELDPAGKATMSSTGFARVTSVYDGQGNLAEQRFFDAEGRPSVALSTGCPIQRYGSDAYGNRTSFACFGQDGEPLINHGFHRSALELDAQGNVLEIAYFDRQGQRVASDQGFAIWRRAYDEQGREVTSSYFGADEKPIVFFDHARRTSKYDEAGNLVEEAFFGVDDKPIALTRTGAARVRYTFDASGHETERTYYGPNGATTPVNGSARITMKWDHGNRVEWASFGTGGQPSLVPSGYAREVDAYDEKGNFTEESFYGADWLATLRQGTSQSGGAGEPPRQGKYARRTFGYDDEGRVTEEAFFGLAVGGVPVRVFVGGFAGYTLRYDDHGREIERSFFGAQKEPVYIEERYVRRTMSYDDRQNKTGEQYFDEDGNLTANADGVAAWHATFDEQSREIDRAYEDASGKPVLGPEGFASQTVRYDPLGNEVERAYFGKDKKLIVLHEDYAKVLRVRDDHGWETETRYFGADDRPALVHGAARVNWKYDVHGRPTDEVHYDGQGHLAADEDGVAERRQSFDDRGDLLESESFGPGGAPVIDGAKGYAKVVSRYDRESHLIEEAYFGVDGKPVLVGGAARKTFGYENGKVVEVATFGADDKPARGPEGYARRVSAFDAHGNETMQQLFDPEGDPVLSPEGWAAWRSLYDSAGHETERTFLGTDGKPVVTAEGLARWAARYDERGGGRIELEYYDARDRPVSVKGFAREVVRYDELGNETQRAYFGADAKRVLCDGYARRTIEYPVLGRRDKRVSYFGTDDKPILRGGFAQVAFSYDERGDRTKVAYFGVDAKPVAIGGVAAIERTFDPRTHELTAIHYLGVDGQPSLLSSRELDEDDPAPN